MPRPTDAGGDALVTDDDLDDLVAPVALYPDAVLTQIFVASTVPLDVVKADRFLSANAGMDDKARSDAIEAEDWDESVTILAAGFPTVIQRMAAEIDWTEDLGDAVIAETDAVLGAVQRMRARAAALGNLESNEAQTVATEGDTISIAPADPEVVYVPSYDPAMAFTSTAPVVVSEPGITTTDVLTTGAIAFGSALLVDAIFDDDDDWDDYWHGHGHIDWDDGDIYPRREINVDGDVNIDVDRNRDDIRERIGDNDGVLAGNNGAWRPSDDQRQAARDRLAERPRPDGGAGAASDRIRERSANAGGGDDARARLERAQASRPAGERRPEAVSAMRPRPENRDQVRHASERGALSSQHDGRARAAAQNHPRNVSRPQDARRPAAHSPSRSSAFKQHGGRGQAAKASRRGGSHGHGRGGGGGGRRR